MGSFIRNLHLRTVSTPKDGVMAAATAVVQLLEHDHLERVDAATPDTRRVVILASSGWVSVFDDAGDALAARLSRALATDALSIEVLDSDRLVLTAFRNGKRTARARRQSDDTKVKVPTPFRALLPAGAHFAAMTRAFAARCLVVDEVVAGVARTLELDARAALTDVDVAARERASVMLSFRDRVQKTTALPPRVFAGMTSWPPDERRGARAHFSAMVSNEGGGARGLDLIVSGSAITTGLLHLSTVRLVIGQRATRVRLRRHGKDLVASAPTLEIPAKDSPPAGISLQKQLDRAAATRMHALLSGKFMKAGEGVLTVEFRLHDGSAQPHGIARCDVHVRPTTRRSSSPRS